MYFMRIFFEYYDILRTILLADVDLNGSGKTMITGIILVEVATRCTLARKLFTTDFPKRN